jgi:BRO family protein
MIDNTIKMIDNTIKMTNNTNDEIIIFKQIREPMSVLNTLIEGIYHEESYQEYLEELQSNDSKTLAKKAANIKQTFADLRLFNTNTEPLFLASDIGIILGVANVNQMVKKYTNTEKVIGHIKSEKGKITKKTFLTRYGVYRIIFNNNTTKLSIVFREFIYKLIDHMAKNELASLRKIIHDLSTDNKDLIKESIIELNENVLKYKVLYEEEMQDRIELTIENNYNEMYINQLKLDREKFLDKLEYRRCNDNTDENMVSINLLKKKFMKEFTISLVNPEILDTIFLSKKFQYDESEKFVFDDYRDNYNFIVVNYINFKKINTEELYYLVIDYKASSKETTKETLKETSEISREILEESIKLKDYIHVASDYVMDRKKYYELVEVLKTECDTYNVPGPKKKVIYKSTIENIHFITKHFLLS